MSIDAWLEGFLGTTRPAPVVPPRCRYGETISAFDWDLITHEGLDAIAKAKLPVRRKNYRSPPSSTRTASIFSISKDQTASVRALLNSKTGSLLTLIYLA